MISRAPGGTARGSFASSEGMWMRRARAERKVGEPSKLAETASVEGGAPFGNA